MTKKKQEDQQPSLLPKRDEFSWWLDWCIRLAGAAFSESAAQEHFRQGLTPQAAANLMREE